MNYYERHMGDYAKDAAHLSLLEHGIYCRLLDVYYIREASIPDSQAARLIGARSQDEIASLAAVLEEFFVSDGEGNWRQERCEKEIARYKEKSAKASASAVKRWSGRRPDAQPTHSEGNAKAMRTHSERIANGMLPKPQTPITKEPPLPPDAGGGFSEEFEEFWLHWPETARKVAKEQCARKWMQQGCDGQIDLILGSLRVLRSGEEWRKNAGQFVPSPLNWLKASGWTMPKPIQLVTVAENPDVAATSARLKAESERVIGASPEALARAKAVRDAARQRLADAPVGAAAHAMKTSPSDADPEASDPLGRSGSIGSSFGGLG